MAMLQAWRLARGYVRIEIRGRAAERFINLATNNGIYMWNIRRGPASLVADVSIGGFRSLRRIARRSGCRIRIRAKRGLPFALKRGKGRYGFVGGLVACLIAVVFVASHVWFVQVTGVEDQSKVREILGVAAACGLKPGAPLSRLDQRQVELGILAKVDYISWVRLRTQGTRVIVDVIEKTLPPAVPAEENTPCHLVASAAGTIESILVYMGEPAVKVGDNVVQGQILIEGRIKGPPAPLPPGQPPPARPPTIDTPVRARGRVIALVVRKLNVEEPYVQWVKVRSGRTFSRRAIRVPGMEIVWKGRGPAPFAESNRISQSASLTWRNIPLPVESITETFHEIVPAKREISRPEAREKAKERAFSSLRREVPAGADVIDVSAESIETDSAVNVTITIRTMEDIGAPLRTR
ncbi:MAG: sporulation protein YqfD [Bacillota bacterium]